MKRLLEICVKDYAWIHTAIGLIGNICFIIGSLLFLDQDRTLGTYFFIVGSTGMFIGNVGNAVVMAIEQHWRILGKEQGK